MLFVLFIMLLATATPSNNRKRKAPTLKPMSAVPRWVSLLEAAEYARIPMRTMRSWVSQGWLPAYRIGPRQIQIDLNDVDALRRRIPTADMS